MPDSTTRIGGDAFGFCSSLVRITIPGNVTTIGSGAFQNCSSLTSVAVPDSVTNVGEGAFSNCTLLTMLAMIALVLSLTSIRTGHEPGEKFFFGLWIGLGLAADIGFGAWARHKLLREFRMAAAQRYVKRAGFWKRLLVGDQPGASAVQLQPVKEM